MSEVTCTNHIHDDEICLALGTATPRKIERFEFFSAVSLIPLLNNDQPLGT